MTLKLYPPDKKHPTWRVRGSYLGARLDRSTGADNRAAADAIMTKWKADIENGRYTDRLPAFVTLAVKHPARRNGGYIYFLRHGERIKIGFSKNPAHRIAEIKTASPERVDLMLARVGTMQDEKKLHELLADYRADGEWFQVCPTVLQVMLAFALPDFGFGEKSGRK